MMPPLTQRFLAGETAARRAYEVQVPIVVRTTTRRDLAPHHDMWQYAPYRQSWPSYLYRRVTEDTDSARLAVQGMLPW